MSIQFVTIQVEAVAVVLLLLVRLDCFSSFPFLVTIIKGKETKIFNCFHSTTPNYRVMEKTTLPTIMETESISKLMERSLDLIMDSESVKSVSEPSAASILMAEKQRMKDMALKESQLGDYVPINSLKNSEKVANPFFDQIAESKTEAPTYWKGIGSQKSKSKKAISVPVITNAKKASHLKGEEYEDRRKNKYASSASRKERMHRIKNTNY